MPLKLDGPDTTHTIATVEDDAHTDITGEIVKDGDAVSASLGVSHERRRWSLVGAVEYVRGKGFGARAKGRIRLGS